MAGNSGPLDQNCETMGAWPVCRNGAVVVAFAPSEFEGNTNMGPFTALMTVDQAAASRGGKRSLVRTTAGWVGRLVEGVRRESAERRLRDQLAQMDDAMLRDIGIADDELYMIRARDQFTPRAWANRGAGKARWEF